MLAAVLFSGCGSSIHDDVARNDIERVRAKIAADPAAVGDTNDIGKTALHYAVSYKRMEIMDLLVASGADVNAQDRTGMTPLHVAAMLGRKDEAAWLLVHGADVHRRDVFGDTPMLTAAVFGGGGVVKTLIQHGARLDDVNTDQLDAVALARKYHQEKMAAFLVKLQAASK
ncbi:MAG: ankyrin repeat domain-containing protein [Candidatus Hydrogenedentes bacterium]|nr:ankyrin repeat domain-containing protein [Candidatus Hydrogenedentota bacterium]